MVENLNKVVLLLATKLYT